MGTTECALPQQRSSRDGIWRCRGVLPLHVSRAVINLEVETVLADWKRFVGGVLLLVVILGFCVLTVAGTATANSEREYVEKAAYLYNFTKFINWPEAVFSSARDPIEICVLGRDDFGASLEALVSGKSLRGRYLVVRKLRGGGRETARPLAAISSS